MKLIKKYILSEFLQPFFWCLILFIFLYCIIDLFEHLDEIVKAKVPLFVMSDYYFSLIPFIFTKICPVVILLATIYTLSNLNRNNEIMAIKAMGINLSSIIWLFLIFGIFMSAVSFLINELVLPESYLHAINLKDDYFKQTINKEKDKIIKNLTLYGTHNRIFIIGSYDVNRQFMNNITISEHNELNQLIKKIVSKRAQWVDGHWIFFECIISEYKNGELINKPTYFVEKSIELSEKPKDIKRADLQPNLMGYWQLRKYIRQLENYGFRAQKERVDFYSKISFPLANFIIIFFAVPFTLTRKPKPGALLGITLSLAVSFSYWIVNAVGLSLGKSGILSPLLAAWLTNIIFLSVGIGLIESVKK